MQLINRRPCRMTKSLAYPVIISADNVDMPNQQQYTSLEINKIRLLKFMTRFGIGGTEKQVVNLSKRLDHNVFDLRFGALQRLGILANELEGSGFSIEEYPINHLYGYKTLRRQWQLSRALKRDRIQIMHSYNFYSNVFSVPAARLARTPCVIASVRDLGVNLTRAQLKVHSWACSMADIVLVNANAIRDWLIAQGIPERKLRVIYNGVDSKKVAATGDGSGFRTELHIPAQAPVITMLSRMEANKGAEHFLRAAPEIMKRCPDAHLVVVGDAFVFGKNADVELDTFQLPKLVQRAKELGIGDCIHFIGERSDVPEILAATTVSVLPSDSEGLSNTLLESMAAG